MRCCAVYIVWVGSEGIRSERLSEHDRLQQLADVHHAATYQYIPYALNLL